MNVAILRLQWFDLVSATTGRAVSFDGRRSSGSLRRATDLAPSVSLDEPFQESVQALLEVFKEASHADWDGYGARPVSAATLSQALAFLALLPATLPRPEVSGHPDGELAFEWSFGRRQILTVSINQSGKLSYAALIGQVQQHGTEFILDRLPETIALALRRVRSGA